MSLLVSSSLPVAARKRRRVINHRHRYVLELHLAGRTVSEIAAMTGYKPPSVYGILNRPETTALRQQIMRGYDLEFEALYPKVVESIRRGLDSEDPVEQREARRDWLKAHGKFRESPPSVGNNTFSAERMVFQILQAAGTGNGGEAAPCSS